LRGAGNELQTFQDRGQYWDAWNIDPDYAQHPLPAAELLRIYPVVHRARGLGTHIGVDRRVGQSTIVQTYSLRKNSPILEIVTSIVNWQERHVVLKAAFPLNLEADSATYDIACGAIQQTTRPQTDRDRARWETPALQWADLSDASYGVSLLNTSKHGYDCQPSQIRLTLLRGTEWPDADADRGAHNFTYALYPHAGNWKSAQTVKHGYELNQPLKVMSCDRETASPTGSLPPVGQLLNLGDNNLILMAFKQSEDASNAWIIRCYECHGDTAVIQFSSDLNLCLDEAIDLLEQPSETINLQDNTATIPPWAIASFKLSVKS
jgi:alpha-mannosidase